MRKLTVLAATVAAFAGATAASAQTAPLPAQPYLGVTGGYHELDGGDELGNYDISTGGAIFGVVGGVDFPLSEAVKVGVEGNFNVGTGRIYNEYGVAGRLAFPLSETSQGYVRGGYQWVKLDVSDILPTPPATLDTTGGDYLVGAGVEFGGARLGGMSVRVGVDTLGFDTIRGTAGLIFKF